MFHPGDTNMIEYTQRQLHIKRRQDGSHRATSSDIQEQLITLSIPFMIKAIIKFGMMPYLNVIMTMHYKCTLNIILNWDKTEQTFFNNGNQSYFTQNHCFELKELSTRNKSYTYRKKESQITYSPRQHDSIHRKPKFSTKRLLEVINSEKVAGCKINIQRTGFLYIGNKFTEKNFKSNFIHKVSKNLERIPMYKQEIKDLYSENQRVGKKVKIQRQKYFFCSWIETNINMSKLPKEFYKFSPILN